MCQTPKPQPQGQVNEDILLYRSKFKHSMVKGVLNRAQPKPRYALQETAVHKRTSLRKTEFLFHLTTPWSPQENLGYSHDLLEPFLALIPTAPLCQLANWTNFIPSTGCPTMVASHRLALHVAVNPSKNVTVFGSTV